MTGERINIGPLARDFKANGVPSDVEIPDVFGITPGSREAFTALNKMKPEIFALSAVLIDRLFEGTERRVELAASLDRRYPFLDLSERLRRELSGKTGVLFPEAESVQESAQILSVRNRLRVLSEARLRLTGGNSDYARNITLGMDTGIGIMSGILDVEDVIGKSRTPEAKVKIAKNTYPLIVNWAAMNAEEMGAFAYALQISPQSEGISSFKPALFQITEDDKVDLSHRGRLEVENALREQVIDRPESVTEITAGCPALVNFGEGSAIKNLWDFHVDIAERVWTR